MSDTDHFSCENKKGKYDNFYLLNSRVFMSIRQGNHQSLKILNIKELIVKLLALALTNLVLDLTNLVSNLAKPNFC